LLWVLGVVEHIDQESPIRWRGSVRIEHKLRGENGQRRPSRGSRYPTYAIAAAIPPPGRTLSLVEQARLGTTGVDQRLDASGQTYCAHCSRSHNNDGSPGSLAPATIIASRL
jgi:hypothetical protein